MTCCCKTEMAHGGISSPHTSSASSVAAAGRMFPAADPTPPCPLIQVQLSISYCLLPQHCHHGICLFYIAVFLQPGSWRCRYSDRHINLWHLFSTGDTDAGVQSQSDTCSLRTMLAVIDYLRQQRRPLGPNRCLFTLLWMCFSSLCVTLRDIFPVKGFNSCAGFMMDMTNMVTVVFNSV